MKISVITVAYNSANTIEHTLHSIASQSYPEIEHVVVDGASSDDTLAIIQRQTRQPDTLISEPDHGIYDAMNKGIRASRGEIVGFLNSDDLFAHDDALADIARIFTDPTVDACYGDLVYVSRDNSTVVRYWRSKPFSKGRFARGWCPPHPTFYVRKSAINRLGLFNTDFRLAADAEFLMRYLEVGGIRVDYIPEVLVRMRLGGATNNSFANIINQNREILRALTLNKISFNTFNFVFRKLLDRVFQYYFWRNQYAD